MLRMGSSTQKVTGRKGKQRLRINYLYQSDFSSGADGWLAYDGVASATGNIDGIGGVDDVLRATLRPAAGKTGTSAIRNPLSSVSLVSSANYQVNLEYFIPSTNDEVVFLEQILIAGAFTAVDSGAVTTDTWHSKTVTFTTISTSSALHLFANEDHDSGTTDLIYFKNIELIRL